jgi:hypothetical protein
MAKKRPTPRTDREGQAYADHLRGIRAGHSNLPLDDALRVATGGGPPWGGPPLPRPQPHPDHRGGFFGLALAHWEFGKGLLPALSEDAVGDMGRDLLERSLGAIRVDVGTSEAAVLEAFRAITRHKEKHRERLGLPDPPTEGSKADGGKWWPGVAAGSVYHRRLTTLYLRTVAKVTEGVEWDASDPSWPAKVSLRPPTLLEIAKVLWPGDPLWGRLAEARTWGGTGRDPGEPKKLGEQLTRAVRTLLNEAKADSLATFEPPLRNP